MADTYASNNIRERKDSESSHSVSKEKRDVEPHLEEANLKLDEESAEERSPSFASKYKPFILTALALVILGWWISSTILEKTRHRWYVAFPVRIQNADLSLSHICQDCADCLRMGFHCVSSPGFYF